MEHVVPFYLIATSQAKNEQPCCTFSGNRLINRSKLGFRGSRGATTEQNWCCCTLSETFSGGIPKQSDALLNELDSGSLKEKLNIFL